MVKKSLFKTWISLLLLFFIILFGTDTWEYFFGSTALYNTDSQPMGQ